MLPPLFHNLLLFERVLRAAGMSVAPGAMIDVARALERVDPRRRTDFHSALRTLLVHRYEDLARFDLAFEHFFRHRRGRTTRDLRALGEERRLGPSQAPTRDGGGRERARAGGRLDAGLEGDPSALPTYSRGEALSAKDFALYTAEEIAEAKAMLATLTWTPALRRTRRWRRAPRGRIDLRRIMSRGLRDAGELIALPRARRREQPRPLIVFCDVSGSMERYSRMLLHFVHAVAQDRPQVDIFLFATRLARVTREARRHDIDALVGALPRLAPDWAGGTRIGEALRAFNLLWARRVVRRGPVALVISDGWDRGDPALVRQEMARLRRLVTRLIWLNPLLGTPGYEPLTRGMQAALPFVDDFLPVHNLDSLVTLAAHLNALPPSAGARPSRPGRTTDDRRLR